MPLDSPNPSLPIVGRVEQIDLLDYGVTAAFAKVDTGADMSSIWASDVREQDNTLAFKLFGPKNEHYTGKVIIMMAGDYKQTRIANSFGHKELRYVVKLKVGIKGRIINATFSLADRSDKLYPILIGRKLLRNKFLVDVAQGQALHEEEKQRKRKLQRDLKQLSDTLGA